MSNVEAEMALDDAVELVTDMIDGHKELTIENLELVREALDDVGDFNDVARHEDRVYELELELDAKDDEFTSLQTFVDEIRDIFDFDWSVRIEDMAGLIEDRMEELTRGR